MQTTECRMQHGIDLHWCADNPVFLETERLIARCIHRQAAEVDLELTAKERATDHAVTSMIENHTTQVRLIKQRDQGFEGWGWVSPRM